MVERGLLAIGRGEQAARWPERPTLLRSTARPDDPADDRAWIRPEDMGTILEVCWSPMRNPASEGAIPATLNETVAVCSSASSVP